MGLDQWAENLTKQVFNEWEKNYSDWKQGVKLFYGPVKKLPKLMILTYNPGGDKRSFQKDLIRFNEGNFNPYHKHEYVDRNYPLARKMRELFSNNLDLLEESVALPIMFFRSKDTKMLKKRFQKNKRKEAEKFCLEKVKQIIDFLHPQKILIIGVSTHKKLRKKIMIGINENPPFFSVYPTKKETLYIISNWKSIPVLTTRHISGSRITIEDIDRLRHQLRKFFKK